MKTKVVHLVIISLFVLAGFNQAMADCEGTAPVTKAPVIYALTGPITVPITMEGPNFQNIAAITLTLNYDPAVLTAPVISPTDSMPSDWTILASMPSQGQVRIVAIWDDITSWTLPSGSLLFNINFTYLGGYSALTWDYSDEKCQYTNASQVTGGTHLSLCQNPPESFFINGSVTGVCIGMAPVTIAPVMVVPAGAISVPITIGGLNFNDIAAITLTLNYNPSVLTYTGSTDPSTLPSGWTWIAHMPSPGQIRIVAIWDDVEPWTISPGTDSFTLNFTSSGGSSTLDWDISDGKCEYANEAQITGEEGAGKHLCQTQLNYTDGLITVACNLAAGISPDPASVCSSGSLQLYGNYTGGTSPFTYLWSGAGYLKLNDVNLQNPTFTSTVPDTYPLTFTVTDGNGCSAFSSINVVVDPLPAAAAGGSHTICSNASYTLGPGEASAANGTIAWTENGAGSITAGAATLTPTYTAAAGDAGNDVMLTMTVTSNNSCSPATATATYTIHVDPLPAATAGGTHTICSNASYTLGAGEASAANGTIAWTENGVGSITAGAATLTPTYTAAAGDAGNDVMLTMTVTSNNSCSPATATATYTIHADPMPTASAGGSQTIPVTGTATVSGASAGYGSILWTHNGLGNLANTTTLTPVYTPVLGDVGTTVTLLMTVTSNNSCSGQTATANYTVIVVPATVAGVSITASPSTVVCAGTSVTFTAVPVNGGVPAYQWYKNGLPVGLNQPTFSCVPLNSDQVYVVMTSSLPFTSNNPATSNTITLTVNPILPVSVTISASPSATICAGTSVTFTAVPVNGGSLPVYQWKLNGNNTGSGGPSYSSSTLVNGDVVKVVLTSSLTCQSGGPATSNCITMTVNARPAPTISGPNSVCLNSTGKVYTTQSGKSNYAWTIVGGTITGGAGTYSITVTWTTVGNQSVSVNYANSNGCMAASPVTYPVTVNPLPVPSITGPSAACVNSCGNIYTTQSGMTGYTWTISSGGIIKSGAGTKSITVTWTVAGPQSVSVNYCNANGCAAAAPASYSVLVYPLPAPTISGPQSVCVASTGNVYTTQSGMTGYTWTISSGGTIKSGAGTNSITVTWNTAGTQYVYVNYTNGNGCSAAAATKYTVTVNPLPVASITASAADFCNGTTLTAHSSTTENSYLWSTGEITQSIFLSIDNDPAGAYKVYVTDQKGCKSSGSASWNYAPENLASSYTVIGYDEVIIGEGNHVLNGSVGVTDQCQTATIRKNAVINGPGSFVKANRITADPTAIILKKILAQATVTMPAMLYNTTCGSYCTTITVPANTTTTITNNKVNITIGANCHVTITASEFGKITIGQGSIVTFTGSTLNIVELIMSDAISTGRSDLEFQADAIVKVKQDVCIGKYCTVNASGANVVFYIGTHTCGSENTLLSIHAEGLVFNASAFAPDGNICVISTDASFPTGYITGKFFADAVDATAKNVYWNWRTCSTNQLQPGQEVPPENENTIAENNAEACNVYPVPNSGHFTVSMNDPEGSVFNVQILNELGGKVFEMRDIHVNGLVQMPVDLGNAPDGFYIIVFRNNDRQMVKRVIISR